LALEDEIDFFNVGQGHAVLVNKIGRSQITGESYVPLLIDAGSSSVPYTHHEQYVWEDKKREELFASKISARILSFWKASNDNILQGGSYRLNIIITHGDDDHRSLIPLILNQLEQKKVENSFTFVPSLLLGGEQRHRIFSYCLITELKVLFTNIGMGE
jgi:hypothetical protein